MPGGVAIGMKCIQYMLFVLNCLFMIVAVILISVGSAILVNYDHFETFLELHHLKPAKVLISTGVIILFVALIGCIGAVKRSTAIVNLFALLQFLLLLLEVAAAAVAFALRCNVFDDIEDNMNKALKMYTWSEYSKRSWDTTQENLVCCGVRHLSDWAPVHVAGPEVTIGDSTFTVPFSCCGNRDCSEVFTKGCWNAVTSYISDSALVAAYVGSAVAGIQILGMLFAIVLGKLIRQVKTDEEMERQQNRHRVYEENRRPRPTPVLHVPSSSDA